MILGPLRGIPVIYRRVQTNVEAYAVVVSWRHLGNHKVGSPITRTDVSKPILFLKPDTIGPVQCQIGQQKIESRDGNNLSGGSLVGQRIEIQCCAVEAWCDVHAQCSALAAIAARDSSEDNRIVLSARFILISVDGESTGESVDRCRTLVGDDDILCAGGRIGWNVKCGDDRAG